MSWTLTTSGAAIVKAGSNSNATIIASGAALQTWSDQVEGRIVAETRRDWVTSYTNLSGAVQNILNDTASDLIAMKIINYDVAANPSRVSETMLDVLRDNASSNLKILREFKSNEIRGI